MLMEALFHGNALRGIEVLVVEDDPESRELLSLFLSASGATVRTASSAPRATASSPSFVRT